ncbi:MAG: Flp family type IVb pilin [Sphingomonadaceae bacterium]
MTTFITAAKQFAKEEDGITAIEYGLIAALMAAAISGGVGLLGPALKDAFIAIKDKINATPTPGS